MKYYVETFGCQMNTADSEEMGRHLVARGFTATSRPEDADWILVNTCTVRQHAEDKAMSYLGRLKKWKLSGPDRRLVVAGCAAERLQGDIRSRFPHVDMVVGAKSIGNFSGLADRLLPEFDAGRESRDAWSLDTDYTSAAATTDGTAHVTIMRGCNYSCTYCIVPAVRGREIYRPPESILEEVRQKAASGLLQVLLLGQTVNSYRPSASSGIQDFADLLRAVDKVPGVKRIRFMSPHPFYVNERLCKAMAESENVCPHIHLPVQSGSDRLLKKMRRNYTRSEYLKRLEELRRAMPHLAVTTDLIVGFPGETEDDFRDTLSLIQDADFEGAYCFKYSARPGTEAAEQADDVPVEVKEERHARLLELIETIAQKKARALLNSRQQVMIEKIADADSAGKPFYEGRNQNFWKVLFSSERPQRVGDLLDVTITEVSNRTLRGQTAVLS